MIRIKSYTVTLATAAIVVCLLSYFTLTPASHYVKESFAKTAEPEIPFEYEPPLDPTREIEDYPEEIAKLFITHHDFLKPFVQEKLNNIQDAACKTEEDEHAGEDTSTDAAVVTPKNEEGPIFSDPKYKAHVKWIKGELKRLLNTYSNVSQPLTIDGYPDQPWVHPPAVIEVDPSPWTPELEKARSYLTKKDGDARERMYSEKNNKVEALGQDLIILTASYKSKIQLQDAIKDRNDYAHKHGFTHHFVNTTKYLAGKSIKEVGPTHRWLHLPAIQETLRKFPSCKWIWLLEDDALIMHSDVNVQHLILDSEALGNSSLTTFPLLGNHRDFGIGVMDAPPALNIEDAVFVVSNNYDSLDLSSMFIRNTPDTDRYIDIWGSKLNIFDDPKWWDRTCAEQFERQSEDAFAHMYLYLNFLRRRTVVVPPALSSSFNERLNHQTSYVVGDFVAHFGNLRETNPDEFHKAWKDELKVKL